MIVNYVIRDEVTIIVDGSIRGPFPKYDPIEAKNNITIWDNAALFSFPGYSDTYKPTDIIQVNGSTLTLDIYGSFREMMETIKKLVTDRLKYQL